jgi:glycosyltransferase involved in cell wall biosynthesis
MKILLVHPHDVYSRAEPWTVRIVYLAREFIQKGHEVKLAYFPLEGRAGRSSALAEGIETIPFSRRHGPHILLENIIRMSRYARWADVVHVQKCFYHAAVPAFMASFWAGKPLHYDWDDWEVKIYEASTQPGFITNAIRIFLQILESCIPKIADTVSVASARLRIECLRLIGDSARIFDAPVGADLKRFNSTVSGSVIRQKYGIKNKLVLYLGQLHGGQYVELFIRAAQKLVSEGGNDATFMIVGDGYLARELRKLSSFLGLDGELIFAGAVSHDLVPQYVAAADVCVACFEENEVTLCKSPLKVVEYLASGKAIVASNVGEVPRMLKDAGILTKPGDIESLSQGIARLLQDESLKKKLEILARERAEKEYNWTQTAGNILNAYNKACGLRKGLRI